MSILMPCDTRQVLGPDAGQCNSRSLFKDRFADPAAKDSGEETPRREWFRQMIGKSASLSGLQSRQRWLTRLHEDTRARVLYGQLQGRLMVNMAGGVMENAGLCLDRFGIPYIPGSAIKGCARRMALRSLHDLATEGAGEETLVQQAATILRVFGWVESDWKTGRKPPNKAKEESAFHSDLEWALPYEEGAGNVPSRWSRLRKNIAERLLEAFPARPRKHPDEPWLDLPHFAGSIRFLPAQVVDIHGAHTLEGLPHPFTQAGKLELDVLTSHHPKYYAQPASTLTPPTDTEDPNPVVFPAVQAGQVFGFSLLPNRQSECPMDAAVHWLKEGLQCMGLGAKTVAGYGWFDMDATIHEAVRQALMAQEKKEREQQERERQEAEEREKEQQREARKQEREQQLAGLTGLEREIVILDLMNEGEFRTKLNEFLKMKNEEQKQAIVHVLRREPEKPASRRAEWVDLKKKADRGGQPARLANAIRELSKQMFPGKEGKMP